MESFENGGQISNALSVYVASINGGSDKASYGDRNDGSLPGSNDGSDSKRKVGFEDERFNSNEEDDSAWIQKKRKLENPILVAPLRFLKPPQPVNSPSCLQAVSVKVETPVIPMMKFTDNGEITPVINHGCRQFWKAGDYEGTGDSDYTSSSVGMEHVRVHPKFLHSNATSHKWALGAFAELLDNSLDEVCNGATYVDIDMLESEKDRSKMIVVEDDGGGMGPEKMRQCMSLGYSSKRNKPNTIGQYGNGFKTSTMRLGADVIVFSRSQGNASRGATQSIGMLSYTFLRGTGKEDIVVPMVDFELKEGSWNKMMRCEDDWNTNLETIARWSPYATKDALLYQFNSLKDHGTRIIIYNLWEDDEGNLELDFEADPYDIQIRGVNRDEKNIKMAQLYPNSRHFLTYRHSLRIYASILYLRLPPGFRVILRGKHIDHHHIVNDLMLTKEMTYRPQLLPPQKLISVSVTIGFVKDARAHIDVQGFNVYHKNRLIKPFWRIWNPAGSDGRGVIGVLEANFVEPAHDKQSFERTNVLSRLETRLIQMQKTYWSQNCHEVGYSVRRRSVDSYQKECLYSESNWQSNQNGQNTSTKNTQGMNSEKIMPPTVNTSFGFNNIAKPTQITSSLPQIPAFTGMAYQMSVQPQPPAIDPNGKVGNYNDDSSSRKLKEEQHDPSERVMDHRLNHLLISLHNERSKYTAVENQVVHLSRKLCEANQKIEEKEKKYRVLLDFVAAEMKAKSKEMENLKKSLKDASTTINNQLSRIIQLENNHTLLNPKNEQ